MTPPTTSYKQIMKSTGLFGGSQVVNILVGFLRTKVVAVLLGPSGVGLIGLYQSIIDTVRSVTDMGLSFSAVKDVSEAHATQQTDRMASTILVLKRWVMLTAIVGALLTLLCARFISQVVFDSPDYRTPIACLSVAVLMLTISAGQRAMLQGMRRIGDMAKASIFASLLAFVGSSVLYACLGQRGIVPSLLLTALITLCCSTRYAMRISLPKVRLSWHATLVNGKNMLLLGGCNLLVGVAGTLSLLWLKSFIGQRSGMETVGLFQSCWSVTALSLSAILSSMAADYYPRLCATATDNVTTNRYVNEQLRVALLLSTVVVVGMIVFSPVVLQLFYSSRFLPAMDLLRWQLLGGFIKVLNWPLAYVLLSRGKGGLFLMVELLWYALYLGLTILLWPLHGLTGAGEAYLLAHLIYTIVLLALLRSVSGFSVARSQRWLMLGFSVLVGGAFVLSRLSLPSLLGYVLSSMVWLLVAGWSLFELNRIYPLKPFLSKLKSRLGRRSN